MPRNASCQRGSGREHERCRLAAEEEALREAAHGPELARTTRLRLWPEHLELPEEALPEEPAAVIGRWRPIAAEQLARREAGQPPTHRLLALPGVSRRSRRLRGPLHRLLVER